MIENLTDELILHCFSFIDFSGRSAIFLTSKRLNELCFLGIPSDSFDVIFFKEFRGQRKLINDYLKGNVNVFELVYKSIVSDFHKKNRNPLLFYRALNPCQPSDPLYRCNLNNCQIFFISRQIHKKIVEWFLQHCEINDPMIKDCFESSCSYCVEESLDLLMKSGVSVAEWFEDSFNYNFFKAILDGDVMFGTLQFLISLKPDLNKLKWYDQLNPLSFAVTSRLASNKIIKLLLDNGADINFYSDDCENPTALSTAIDKIRIETVKFLVENGADVNLCSSRFNFVSREIADYLVDCGMDVNKISLYEVCRRDLTESMEIMLSIGAKVNTKSIYGEGCLDGVLDYSKQDYCGSFWNHIITLVLNVCRIILPKAENVNDLTQTPKNLLYRVCHMGSKELVDLFRKYGANFNAPFTVCDPPIIGAIESCNLDLVRYN